MTISNDGPASYEQVEALQEAMQEQMRAMQMKIEEYESKFNEQQSKLDEIKSYVEPKEAEKMDWDKFFRRLTDQMGDMSYFYFGKFKRLRKKFPDIYALTKKEEMLQFVG